MKILLLIMAITSFSLSGLAQNGTLHQFKAKDIEGNEFNFALLKGKKVIIVNTASRCGFTPQYKILQKLYETYGGDNFEIIGFPANNFLQQEPGSNKKIEEFCSRNYGVTFKMMSKISVKGKKMHPIYQWLTKKSENGVMDAPVKWNFQKFLIDENGNLVDYLTPATKPDDPRIIDWIEK